MILLLSIDIRYAIFVIHFEYVVFEKGFFYDMREK